MGRPIRIGGVAGFRGDSLEDAAQLVRRGAVDYLAALDRGADVAITG